MEILFDAQSEFHGDGARIYVSASGEVAVERLEHGDDSDHLITLLYRARLTPELLSQLNTAVASLLSQRPAVVDRLGIPDEVRDHLEVKDGQQRFEVAVWSTNWSLQPPALMTLRALLAKAEGAVDKT